MEITHAAASFSPQVTRPATKASAHSAAGMQRLVRAAVQDTVLLLHGAIAGAPQIGNGRGLAPAAPPSSRRLARAAEPGDPAPASTVCPSLLLLNLFPSP